MKIAVVILNWNGKNLLEKFLPSIIKYSHQATVYVADNASSDDSIPFVVNNFPTVKVIKNAHNFGFARGYNEALKQVDADIFALINSDIEVTENWLDPIISTFKNETNTAVVQPKILDFNNKLFFEYAGAAGGFIDKYGYAFCRGRIFDSIEKNNNQYESQTIFWASGACFFIRSKVFFEVNGFDEDFFAHQEEIDLCWRAYNRNHDVRYISESTVYHVGAATLEVSNPQKTYLNFRNSLLMLLKNLPKSQIVPIICTRMILDGVAAFQFLLKWKLSHFFAILKAHLSFYTMIRTTYKKRDYYQDATYFYTKSIVKSYFIKKIKTFNKLF
jgi:hypothetical protein